MAHWQSESISAAYNKFRPQYPTTLFASIAKLLRKGSDGLLTAGGEGFPSRALDIGTGTGQAMSGLSPMFREIVGVDPSQSQVAAAAKYPNVSYAVGGAESFVLPNDREWRGTVSLITVAQALHWFDMPKFLAHVDHFLAPGGLLATWTYATNHLKPQAAHDALHEMDKMLLANGHWPPERRHVDDNYRELKSVIAEKYPCILDVSFGDQKKSTVEAFISYLGTWSGIQRYVKQTGDSKVLPSLKEKFLAASPTGELEVTVPFTLLVFQKSVVAVQSKL